MKLDQPLPRQQPTTPTQQAVGHEQIANAMENVASDSVITSSSTKQTITIFAPYSSSAASCSSSSPLPAQHSQSSECDFSIPFPSLTATQPQHTIATSSTAHNNILVEQKAQLPGTPPSSLLGMVISRKRSSWDINTHSDTVVHHPPANSNTAASLKPALKSSSSPKKQRVTFHLPHHVSSPELASLYATDPQIHSTQNMKQSYSCTALPGLDASTSSDEADSQISGTSTSAELDLNVSPATFVKTILLQAKSYHGSKLGGEALFSLAAQRVKTDDYFLTYGEEHQQAYNNEKVNAVQNKDLQALRSLHSEGQIMQTSNRFGESLLHTACRRGFTEIVSFFIHEANVTPRVRDDMGRTPMHDACWSSTAPNHDVMKMLIASAPEMLLSKDRRGHSPFDYARREHWPSWVGFLNEHRQFVVESLLHSCTEGGSELMLGGYEDVVDSFQ